jgi:hypothetical protein
MKNDLNLPLSFGACNYSILRGTFCAPSSISDDLGVSLDSQESFASRAPRSFPVTRSPCCLRKVSCKTERKTRLQ